MDSEPLELFREYLSERGIHLTAGRAKLAAQILASREAFSAEELCISFPSQSRPTIYRTLSLLVGASLIFPEFTNDGKQFYVTARNTSITVNQEPGIQLQSSGKYAELCAASHRSVIVGKCPWCGRSLLNFESK